MLCRHTRRKDPFLFTVQILVLSSLLLASANGLSSADQLPAVDIAAIEEKSLLDSLSFLEDRSGTLTIQDILTPRHSRPFSVADGKVMNRGFTRAAYWVRFRLANNSDRQQVVLLEVCFPLIDAVDLYQPGPDGRFIIKKAGEQIPIAEREIRYRNPVFSLTLAPRDDQTFYIRYQDRGSVPFALALWEPGSFAGIARDRQFALGLYYGIMLIIIVYNLVIYLLVRIQSYLHYSLFVSIYVLWQLVYNGLASEYLWPAHPWLSEKTMPILISATCLSALHFTRSFLQTKKRAPFYHRLISYLMIALCLLIAASLYPRFALGTPLAALLAIIFAPVVLSTGLACWKKGCRHARYFIVAWTMLLGGTALLGLKSFGLLPSVFITEYGQQIGSVLEAALLSFALADQVRIMRREKEQAQADAARIQAEINERLEQEVRQRTIELQTKNTQLDGLSTKLSKYLSPQLYTSIFTGKTEVTLHSRRRKLTVFFSDIMNFTEMTDSMEPETLTAIINEYLNEMAGIILAHGGTIDKFMGDAIMVFFGDPETRGEKEDTLACLHMALAMRTQMTCLQERWFSTAAGRTMHIRMGINTGYCTVGNFGSENRLDYTIIGGQVNLASRLESLAEADQILISHATYGLIKDEIDCEKKGEIHVRGIAYPVSTYQVIGLRKQRGQAADEIKHIGIGYSLTLNPLQISCAGKKELAAYVSKIISTS